MLFNPMQFKPPLFPSHIFWDLKEAWGAVTPGQEPWRGVKTRQLRVAEGSYPTAMAYSRETGQSLVVAEMPSGEYLFTHWDADPYKLEESLKGEIPYEELIRTGAAINALAVPSEPVDLPRASQVFVKWCTRYSGR